MSDLDVLTIVLNGGDPDLRDSMGRTALMLASQKGDHQAIEQLIKSQKWVNSSIAKDGNLFSRDNDQRTVLFYLAENEDEDAAWIVLGAVPGTGLCCLRGSLLEMKDNQDMYAEDYAKQLGNEKMYRLFSGERLRIKYHE